jgi:hypothetical protein
MSLPAGPIFESRDTFFHYVKYCNDNYQRGHDLDSYRAIIDTHRAASAIDDVLHNESFYLLLHRTLELFNMNQKGAVLEDPETIKTSILANNKFLSDVYKQRMSSIASLEDDGGQAIQRKLIWLLKTLKIMRSKARIVGVSKTLHFLLPDLVMPIDNKYTLFYFKHFLNISVPTHNMNAECSTFSMIFSSMHRSIRLMGINENDVDGKGWNTSVPKLCDNAIIGFLKEHVMMRAV